MIPQSSAIAGAAGAPIRYRSRARILDALRRMGLIESESRVREPARLRVIADKRGEFTER
jgi:hypothetical protein